MKNLKEAGVNKVYLDGSFITLKEKPKDIDGCWDVTSRVKGELIDPVFLNFKSGRKCMKEKFGVDFFIAYQTELGSGKPFIEFFQRTRDGKRKGIILLELMKETF